MTPILEVRELTKHFGSVRAVNGISFTIPRGACFGLLGPNGAGKTTTIEMIEGVTEPTSGDILYQGVPRQKQFVQQAGIQFQSTALMDYLTVQEVLDLFTRFYPKTMPQGRLVELCDLGGFLNQPATKLSGGQRQRLLLALALINDPEIVFLDEPTTGLDPQSRRNFWYLIENIKAAGKTTILTTHYMDEAERLCDQLVIVDSGEIIAEGSPKALLKQHFDCVYVGLDKADFPREPEQWHEPVRVLGDSVEIHTQSVEDTLQKLIAADVQLRSLWVRNPTLDDLFLKLTGHSLRE